MGADVNPHEVVRFLEKHWFEKTGVVTALVIIVLIEASVLPGKAPWWVIIATIILTIVFVVLIWWISKRPPKTPKGKVGFLIGIACSDDKESEKVREDFVIPLRQLIKSGKAGHAFHFMELPQHLAKRIIEPDKAQLVRVRSRAHFMLYGRVRLRKLEGKELHVIDIEGVVAHKPISNEVSEALAKEFSELLPRKVHLPIENDLLTFQFTSEWADIVARYIIGIAAACSGDLTYAETLYTDALERLKGKDSAFPVYLKLTERIPIRISELNETKAHAVYKAWSINRNPSYIDQMGSYLEKVGESRRQLPNILNLSAIHAFLKQRDADSAIMFLKKSKDQNNGMWHYNIAFLYGYKGDLKLAIRHYRQAAVFLVEADTIAQIEDFMCWVLQEEPEKCQLHYCLGFFNWQAKGDEIQAEKDLREFLSACDQKEFLKERELASQWLHEIAQARRTKPIQTD